MTAYTSHEYAKLTNPPPLCGYAVFYKGSRSSLDVYADTSYHAQLKAAEFLQVKPKHRHLISVVLCEKPGGEQVVHSTAEVG